jgi:5'-phosphate synthase pdxT subunit
MSKIGVLAIQGDVSEHVNAVKRAAEGSTYEIVKIKHKGAVSECDALIIPGGESTTISNLLYKEGIAEEILRKKEMPIMGTCAGLIILSSHSLDGVKSLKLMDTTVVRNAFGRQVDSFEVPLDVKGFSSKYNGIFIRAPAIIDVGKDVDVLAKVNDYIVAARQGNKLALAFHPELTDDLRFHSYFINMIENNRAISGIGEN